MHFTHVLAASLAMIPSILAQSTTPATSPTLFNGDYVIKSSGDGTILSRDSREGVFALRDPTTRNSTWYINAGPSGFAFIASARRGGVLTGVNGRNDGNPFESQVQARDVATDDDGRRKQAWRLYGYNDGTFEIMNADLNQFLDVRGGVNVGPEVILWTRNQPVSGNQRWTIEPFSFRD